MSLLRCAIASGLMSIAPLLVVLAAPVEKLSGLRPTIDLESAVPVEFGHWRVDESLTPMPLSPHARDLLKPTYDQLLSRTYANPKGDRVMLSMAYGSSQTGQLRVHRQEGCYRSQGFVVSGLERVPMRFDGRELSATRFIATRGSRSEPVTYWFTVGDEVIHGFEGGQLVQLKYAVSGYIPDGYLIRLSSLSADANEAYARHAEFAGALLQSLDPRLRSHLVGQP